MQQPSNPSEKSIDPRVVVKDSGIKALAALLCANARYVPQLRPLKALANCLKRNTPLLCEGMRGGGKTALAEAVGEACNLPVYYLQCMHGLTVHDILFEWDRAAQSQFVQQQISAGTSISAARAAQWDMEFLNLGEVLEAFDAASKAMYPPVLIIDEIDKLDARSEDTLLQVLARGYAQVPRLKPDSRVGIKPVRGRPGRNYPIVILTSNNQREGVSSPLRSRCRCTFIKPPTLAEEVMILHTRVPAASRELLAQVCKLMKALRGMGSIVEKPGLRESIEFLDTLVADGIMSIDASVIDDNIDVLAKYPTDADNIDTGIQRLIQVIHLAHTDIDGWIDNAFRINEASRARRPNLLAR